jgi:hypothetical protein
MSITGMSRPIRARAAFTVGANSVSVSSSLASPWLRQKAMASASRRTLRVLMTAPAMGTAKVASYISGVLAPMMATVSRWPMPRLERAEASFLTRV